MMRGHATLPDVASSSASLCEISDSPPQALIRPDKRRPDDKLSAWYDLAVHRKDAGSTHERFYGASKKPAAKGVERRFFDKTVVSCKGLSVASNTGVPGIAGFGSGGAQAFAEVLHGVGNGDA
jgi:hypothetical protein